MENNPSENMEQKNQSIQTDISLSTDTNFVLAVTNQQQILEPENASETVNHKEKPRHIMAKPKEQICRKRSDDPEPSQNEMRLRMIRKQQEPIGELFKATKRKRSSGLAVPEPQPGPSREKRSRIAESAETSTKSVPVKINMGCTKWDIREDVVKTICSTLDYSSMLGEDKHTNMAMANFNRHRHTGLFCDVKLQVGKEKKEFLCHKMVLLSTSDYFSAMFKHKFKECSDGGVSIVEIDPEGEYEFSRDVVERVLNFLYLGILDHWDAASIPDIYILAHMWLLDRLKKKCVTAMLKDVCIDNFHQFLDFAERFDISEIKISCETFVSKNLPDLLSTSEFLSFSSSQLLRILKDPLTYCHDKFAWLTGVERWSESNEAEEDQILSLLMSAKLENIERSSLENVLDEPFAKMHKAFHDNIKKFLANDDEMEVSSRTIYLPVDGYAFHTDSASHVIQYDNSIGIVLNFRDSSLVTKPIILKYEKVLTLLRQKDMPEMGAKFESQVIYNNKIYIFTRFIDIPAASKSIEAVLVYDLLKENYDLIPLNLKTINPTWNRYFNEATLGISGDQLYCMVWKNTFGYSSLLNKHSYYMLLRMDLSASEAQPPSWEVIFSMTKGPPVTRELRILDIDPDTGHLLLSGIKRSILEVNSSGSMSSASLHRRFKSELLIAEVRRSGTGDDKDQTDNDKDNDSDEDVDADEDELGWQIKFVTSVPKFELNSNNAAENIGHYSLCCKSFPEKTIYAFLKSEQGKSIVKAYNTLSGDWTMLPEMKFSKNECRLLLSEGNLIAIGGTKDLGDDDETEMCEVFNFDIQKWGTLNLLDQNLGEITKKNSLKSDLAGHGHFNVKDHLFFHYTQPKSSFYGCL